MAAGVTDRLEAYSSEERKERRNMTREIKKCECGLVWKLVKVKTPYGIRDSDSLQCSCGRELISWNGRHTWTAEVVNKGEKNSR